MAVLRAGIGTRVDRDRDGWPPVILRWFAVAVTLPACVPPHAARGAPACSTDGVAVVASQRDVARLAGCRVLGGLVIRTGTALDLSPLAALTAVAGDLVIGPTVAIESVTLGALGRIGGAVRVVSNGSLQGLYLTQLTDAGGIEVAGNAVIATVALPGLTAVHGALQVIDNPALEALDLSALTAIDQELVVTGAPALTVALAPQLQRAAAVQLDAPKLPPELARALRSVAPGP